jgi:hypothetical protein
VSAIEKYAPGAPAIAELSDRQWAQLEKKAHIFANTQLSPERWRGKEKEPDILAVGLTLHSVGVDLTLSTLNQCYVIGGQVQMMAQLQMGIADSHGIDCWFEPGDVSDTGATISIRKQGSVRVDRYTYTYDMARKAHHLDEWAERWVSAQSGKKYPERVVVSVDGVPVEGELPDWAKKQVADGRTKRKDPYFNNRQQMFMARATTLGLKVAAPSVLLGLPAPDLGFGAAMPEPDVAPAQTTTQLLTEDATEDDVEVLGDETEDVRGSASEDGGEAAAEQDTPPSPAAALDPASAEDRERVRERIASLGEEWKEHVAVDWRRAEIPRLTDPAFTAEHVAAALQLVTTYSHKKSEVELKRQKQVNANLTEIGITTADARHAFIRDATGGETESSAGLNLRLHQMVMFAVGDAKRTKRDEAAQDAAAAPDPSGSDEQEPMWDDDDPGRPFD